MIDTYAAKMAEILTSYSSPVQAGDYVVIMGSVEAEPLMDALTVAVLERGGHPYPITQLPNTMELILRHASDEQLLFNDPTAEFWVNQMDAIFRIASPVNTKATSDIDPQRMATFTKGRAKWLETYRRRRERGEFRWTVCLWPTVGLAQEAEMGLQAYRQFVFEACGLMHNDPIAYWQEFRERQMRYVEWMQGKENMTLRGPGIDLTMSVKDRIWLSAHGTVNFPDGEIFTGPIEDTVNGSVAFSYPTVYDGRRVEGARLTFKDGKVVEASAQKGEDFLYSKLDADEGARFLGEIAIGTNNQIQRFTGNTLFDEKIGGTIHMALGQSYAESGAKNQSVVHWDMVHSMRDGGEIIVDGTVIYRSGEFLI